MPTELINFGPNQASGDQEIAGAMPSAFNVVIDGKGAVRRRPGLSAWEGFPAEAPVAERIDGIHAFDGKVYYVTEGRKIFQVSGGVASNFSTSGANSFLAGTSRPVFAETEFRLVIAGGLALSKVDSLAVQADILGGSPPDSTQVAALARRLFINNVTASTTIGRINFSGVASAGNETFGALNFVTAEANPDALVALRENSNELYAFGEKTLQAFSSDPISVIAPGCAVNRGCSSAHSVVRVDESFAWLDEKSRFVLSDGRSMDVISDPIATTLEGLTEVSDVWGCRVDIGQFDLLTWVAPTDGRTFAFQRGGGWAQWSRWNGSGHTTYPATSHYYWPARRIHLVGLSSGVIAKVDAAADTDLGELIKAEATTGFLDRGTSVTKVCKVLRVTVKPGATSSTTTEPELLISWRDDPNKPFCNPRRVGLGTMGAAGMVKELRTLGPYRSRQWKMEFTGGGDFVLARVEETFALGGN
jgi:hypothetical protein